MGGHEAAVLLAIRQAAQRHGAPQRLNGLGHDGHLEGALLEAEVTRVALWSRCRGHEPKVPEGAVRFLQGRRAALRVKDKVKYRAALVRPASVV